MIEWGQNVISGLKIIVSSPLLLALIVLIYGASAWLHNRIFKRSIRAHNLSSLKGWETPAAYKDKRHETGIGKTSVLVMKPARRMISIAFWSLLFWGAGAAFFWYAVLPDPTEQTFKNWAVFVGMCLFCALSLFLFAMSLMRIEVTDSEIKQRRFMRRPRVFLLSSISAVAPVNLNPALGLVLTFSDGRKLRLLASFRGYGEMLEKIRPAHPQLSGFIAIGKFAKTRAIAKLK